tara:strand:+ start:981 stop:1175 length:195 start_codon:yes stop_codon:yes gene_type:complete
MIDCFFYYIVEKDDVKEHKVANSIWEEYIKKAESIRNAYDTETIQKWIDKNKRNYVADESHNLQ